MSRIPSFVPVTMVLAVLLAAAPAALAADCPAFLNHDFKQEAKDEAAAAEVCYINYGVTFTMLSASAVTGRAANPVFQELGRRSDRHFDSGIRPDSVELQQAIEQLLR